jgi:hypothetical protein
MTRVSSVETLIGLAVGTLALLALPMADLAAAQDRPGLAAEFAAGWVGFTDDGIVSESLVGGAARWYLLPRITQKIKTITAAEDHGYRAKHHGSRAPLSCAASASERCEHRWLRVALPIIATGGCGRGWKPRLVRCSMASPCRVGILVESAT